MATVPRRTINQAKIITEHDVLKFVGAVATALLVPFILWGFVTLNNKLESLSEGMHSLNIKVAILETKLINHHNFTSSEFEIIRSQTKPLVSVQKAAEETKR